MISWKKLSPAAVKLGLADIVILHNKYDVMHQLFEIHFLLKMVQILHLLPCTLWEMAEGKSQWKPMFWYDIDHCFVHIKFSQAYQTESYSVFPVNTRSQKMIHLLFFRALLLLCIFSSVWCYVWLHTGTLWGKRMFYDEGKSFMLRIWWNLKGFRWRNSTSQPANSCNFSVGSCPFRQKTWFIY